MHDRCLKWTDADTVVKYNETDGDYHNGLASKGFTSGVHIWEWKILTNNANMRLGIAEEGLRLNTQMESGGRVCACHSSGNRYQTSPNQSHPNASGYNPGDRLRFELDLNGDGTLTVTKNDGEDYAEFTGIGGQEWFPAYGFDYQNDSCSVTIISSGSGAGVGGGGGGGARRDVARVLVAGGGHRILSLDDKGGRKEKGEQGQPHSLVPVPYGPRSHAGWLINLLADTQQLQAAPAPHVRFMFKVHLEQKEREKRTRRGS